MLIFSAGSCVKMHTVYNVHVFLKPCTYVYIYIHIIYIYYIRIYIYGLCESEFPDLNLSSSLSIWHMYEFVIQDIPNAPTVRTHLPHPLGGIFLPGDISFSQSFGSNPICGQTHLDLSTVRQLTRWTTLLLVGLLDKKESKTGLYIYIYRESYSCSFMNMMSMAIFEVFGIQYQMHESKHLHSTLKAYMIWRCPSDIPAQIDLVTCQ